MGVRVSDHPTDEDFVRGDPGCETWGTRHAAFIGPRGSTQPNHPSEDGTASTRCGKLRDECASSVSIAGLK